MRVYILFHARDLPAGIIAVSVAVVIAAFVIIIGVVVLFVCMYTLLCAGDLPDGIIAVNVIAVVVPFIIIIGDLLVFVALVICSCCKREQRKLEYRSASLSFCRLLSMVCSAIDLLDMLQP